MIHDKNNRKTPSAAHYAVIFTSRRASHDHDYNETARQMLELATKQPGFLGVESARNPDGFGITVSYWKDRAAIAAWKKNTEHRAAQLKGKEKWYECYHVRLCKVENEYGFPADHGIDANAKV